MPRVSTLVARTNLLRDLKEQAAVIKNKDARLKQLKTQLETAERGSFPQGSIDFIQQEISRVQRLEDDGLEQKIDALSTWITAEQRVAKLFEKPEKLKRAAKAPKAEGEVKRRGRPPKNPA